MKNIDIAFCFNDAFCALAAGAISSIIRHSSENNQYHIYIVNDNISDYNQYLINTLNEKQNVRISFVKIDFDSLIKEDISYTRQTIHTFTRLFLHKLFPHIDKMLYLDGDIIVTSDIAEVFNQSLGGGQLVRV